MDNKLKIINYLGKNMGEAITMHMLSNLLFIPYTSFHRAINTMKDMVITEAIGKAKIIRLNAANPAAVSYLAVSSHEEAKEFLEKNPVIKEISRELETGSIILLFGSYAKGKPTKRSDIDIMVINKKGNRDVSFSKHELLFRKQINPIYVSEQEFAEMLKANEENVGKQALKSNIVLANPERFWGMVLNGVRQKGV
ncbi:MAG: nucleotidyltransferase domain-containing protein [Nanoarchaeota archaeon]|nr:nucleotidyltransferase domain-containing protein [Nanoarchaeota archaeon]